MSGYLDSSNASAATGNASARASKTAPIALRSNILSSLKASFEDYAKSRSSQSFDAGKGWPSRSSGVRSAQLSSATPETALFAKLQSRQYGALSGAVLMSAGSRFR